MPLKLLDSGLRRNDGQSFEHFHFATFASLRLCVGLFLLLTLTACGFHLRGTTPFPMNELALVDAAPSTDVFPELGRALLDVGIRISDSAPLTLQLQGETSGKRVLSVTTEGRAREYGLRYVLRFSLRHEDGSVWLNNEQVEASRDLRFDESAVLAAAAEEVQLKSEMRREAVDKVLRILQHAKPPARKAD
jgi:LPS-assembly lipoprotein